MIAIVDCGIGNLRSVHKAFERVGHAAHITRNPKDIAPAQAVVLPGQGAFRDCMAQLGEHDLLQPVLEFIRSGRPYLGICLGLQLLMTESEEFGCHKGMNIVPGRVRRFPHGLTDGQGHALKVPHMGWNQIEPTRKHPLLKSISPGDFAYFAHSYYAVPTNPAHIIACSDYGQPFPTIVGRENVCAIQFHPEKSQQVGLQILKNFVNFAEKVKKQRTEGFEVTMELKSEVPMVP